MNILRAFLLGDIWGLSSEQDGYTHAHGPLFQGEELESSLS